MASTGRALVTGATGLIGRRIVAALGDRAVAVARDSKRAEAALRVETFGWNGTEPIPARALEGVTTVFHLAGEPVAAGRWTTDRKRRIIESRRDGTRAVVRSIAGRGVALVSASAIGYYGSRGNETLDEESTPGTGFLVDVCRAWETEALSHDGSVAIVRIGIVLAPDGGALGAMLPLFRAGLGGRIGDGRQWMSWIHVDDVVRLFLHAAERSLTGPVCAVSPSPVTNAEFSNALGRALHRPALLPAPAFALRAALGEMAGVVLSSQRVVPKRAEASGFVFAHEELGRALADVVGPP
jgi:uncharacterized protein